MLHDLLNKAPRKNTTGWNEFYSRVYLSKMINACLITSKISHLFGRRGFLQSFQTESLPFELMKAWSQWIFYIASMYPFKDFSVGMLYLKISCPLLPINFILQKEKKKYIKKKFISLGSPSKKFHITPLNPGEEQHTPHFRVCCSVISISEEKSCPLQEDLFFLLGIVFDVL